MKITIEAELGELAALVSELQERLIPKMKVNSGGSSGECDRQAMIDFLKDRINQLMSEA